MAFSYIDETDLDMSVQDRHIQQIIGDDTNSLFLEKAERAAWEEIKSYLRTRFDVDIIQTNISNYQNIKKMIVDIMIYNILVRVTPNNIPEIRVIRYKDAIEYLREARDSMINPDWPTYDLINGEEPTGTKIQVGGQAANNWYY